MEQIIEALKSLGVVSAIGGALIAYIISQYKAVKALKKGVQALLRAQMVSDYNKWSERGYSPLYAKENFENCWLQYEALGANGVMKKIHDDFMALPQNLKEEKTDE